MIQPMPLDFVISYNQEDEARAAHVHRTLEEAGLVGWIDLLYHCVPNQPLESQLSQAWSKARFIIVLASGNFRDSDWCRAEYGQGLAAERDLPLRQVLVLHESREKIPEALRHHPSFPLNSPGLDDLGRFLHLHHFSTAPRPDTSFAVDRWTAAACHLDECRDLLGPAVSAQLQAASDVGAWVREYLTGESAGSSATVVRLCSHRLDFRESHSFTKEQILEYACSDTFDTDGIPFQRFLYDAVNFDTAGMTAAAREAIERIAWNQLPLLASAPNRFFRGQMIESAAELGFRAAFALTDDPAHKHFNAIDAGDSWGLEFQRAAPWNRRSEILTLLGDGDRLASPIEHALLARWQARRSVASRLPAQLPAAERVALAGKGCLLMLRGFVEEEVRMDPLPRHAELLDLYRSHSRQHLGPNLYLETFYYTIVDFLGSTAFRFFSEESVAKMEGRTSPYAVETLEALEAALRNILPRYVETLEVWRLRRNAAGFQKELIVDFVDHVIGPYAVLCSGRIEVEHLRKEVLAALKYLAERGDAGTQALAALVVSELDRPLYVDTPEFSYRMLQALDGENDVTITD
jgi:hypothetical protein